jgi:spore protease
MALIKTDLAVEARELASSAGRLEGVESSEEKRGAATVTRVRVLNEKGAAAIGKPKGEYVTIDVPELGNAQDETFSGALEAAADELKKLLEPIGGGEVLVAGLGNAMMTPDAVGPRCVRSVIVTRHVAGELKKLPGLGDLRGVSAIAPGVLGQTGVEAGEVLKAVVAATKPAAVIAVDALVSRRTSRLGRTVQLADTGIVPGSGVNNARFAVDRRTLGVPVISMGVPTVVEAATLVYDLMESAGLDCGNVKLGELGKESMFVTPRYIDSIVEHAARLAGFAINRALNPSIGLEDMAALVS